MNRYARVWMWAIAAMMVVPVSTQADDRLPKQLARENDGSPEASPTTAGKSAPPGAEELQRSRKEIRTVLKDEFSKGKSNDDRISLALVLFDHAKKTLNDPVSKYALLDEAREAAASAGQSELVLKAIDELAADFDIDAIAVKTESLVDTAKHLKDADDRQAFVEAASRAADDAVEADDFEHALKLASTAQSVAVKARDTDLKKRATSRVTELRKLQKEWESLADAREKLKTSPDDSGANAQVGRYLCLLRGDWEHGLPLLAKGGDKKFAPLAERESADPAEAEEQIKLADDWWAAAQGESPAVKDRVQAHAAEWYSRALPQLDGISKVRIEKRLASLEGRDRPKKSKKPAAQQPPEMVGNPITPAGPNNRPIDYDFERKFAQRLRDKKAQVYLRGERAFIGGNIEIPNWPFYVEAFIAFGNSDVDDDDLVDAQRLHGLKSITIGGNKVTDRSITRIARNGTLRSVDLGINTQISLNALQRCTELESLSLGGNIDLPAINALAPKLPRLISLTLLSPSPASLDLSFLPKFPALHRLTIQRANLTEEMLDALARCRTLRELTLGSMTFAVDDIRPKSVSGNSIRLELNGASLSAAQLTVFVTLFPKMHGLFLSGAKLDGDAWKELKGLSGLRTLDATRSTITDDDLQYLPETLLDLNLTSCSITGEGFQKRRKAFPELHTITFTGALLTDEGLKAALRLTPALKHLFVGQTGIGPEALEPVSKLQSIFDVSVRGLADADRCLEPLSKANSLRRVYGKFSQQAVTQFGQIRPDCSLTP